MTARLDSIWRHPIKGHGSEWITKTPVIAGQTLPWDRTWAVAHQAARYDGTGWAHCANFVRGAKIADIMAISAAFDEQTRRIRLDHPRIGGVEFDPATEAQPFLDWLAPLMPLDRPAPVDLVTANERGMTDSPFPSIALIGTASLRALSGRAGRPLDPRRFRANFWIDGLGPFEEFEWVDRSIRIGNVDFKVEQRITRCQATAANPDTGQRDTDVLGILDEAWGHTDIGVYLIAQTDGQVSEGDQLEVLG